MSQRFILLQLITPHYHQGAAIRNMAEVEQLVETYGGLVVEKSVQHRLKPHSDTYIGPGKLDWLQEIIEAKNIDVVVLNHVVNSGQLFRLEKALWKINPLIKVWDRVDLILNIFDLHATSPEAKLQIRLARVQHIGPRIYGLGGTVLSRQGGGGGGGGGARRGAGETNIEIERRNIKKEKQLIEKELKRLSKLQEQRLDQRRNKGISTVALVGYTSAGKTTLFNALTAKDKQAHQSLFTTLDTVVGKLKLRYYTPNVLISDTIGFIDELPTFLIQAFRSTLMESIQANLLLHVVDASDPRMDQKIAVVEQILTDLDVQQKPVFIFNKVDMLDDEAKQKIRALYEEEKLFLVSAKTGEGLAELKKYIADMFGVLDAEYLTQQESSET